MKKTIGAQLSLGFALIILVTVGIISLASNLLITREFESYVAKQQREVSDALASGLSSQYDGETGGWNVDYIHGLGMYALNDGYILKVYGADGQTVWDAENHDMEYCHNVMQEIEERMEKAGKSGDFITHAYSLSAGGEPIGRAEISYYSPYYFDDDAFTFVGSLNRILLVTGALAVAAAVCVGILFARSISRPIERVTEIADEIANGNYGARDDGPAGTRELRELRDSINHMAEQIARQEEMRRQLTSDVAHELRTPLANVSAQLEVILEGVFEPTPQRLSGVYEEVARLSELVAELEKLQKVENDRLERSEFDLYEEAASAAATFEAEMNKRGISCDVSGNPTAVYADRNKIRQVILNLISNAVKYSRGGAVAVSVRDDGENALLSVKDEGIGIPERERALIFERFYRTDKSRNRKTGGAGIGLAIVKAIVKAHGGEITVESAEDVGSTFTVILPKRNKEEKGEPTWNSRPS